MRTLLPTFALLLLAAPAFAGSIEPVSRAISPGTSIATISCGDCPALKPKAQAQTYHVDAIDPGTQKVEIREANGERKIFRTEAWMGGSPVLFVSKAPVETIDAAENGNEAQTVDAGAKTSAVGEEAAREARTAEMATPQPFEPEKFELRVN